MKFFCILIAVSLLSSCAYLNPNSQERLCEKNSFSCIEPKAIYSKPYIFDARTLHFSFYRNTKVEILPALDSLINPLIYAAEIPPAVILGALSGGINRADKGRLFWMVRDYDMHGVHFEFPTGERWMLIDEYNTLNKKFIKTFTENKDQPHSTFITIDYGKDLREVVKSDEEFIKTIKAISYYKEDLRRVDVVASEAKIDKTKNTYCVRFYEKYKDYKAKNLPQSAQYLILENYGITCQHSIYKDKSVSIIYSDRHLDSSKLSSKKEADAFINGIRFSQD